MPVVIIRHDLALASQSGSFSHHQNDRARRKCRENGLVELRTLSLGKTAAGRSRVSVSSVSHKLHSVATHRKFYRFGAATSPDHGTTSSRLTALLCTLIAERSTKRWPLPRANPAPASTADSRTTGTVNVISASSRARLRAEFRSGNYLSVSVFPPSRSAHEEAFRGQCLSDCS